jgi:hypothetical protein
MWWDVDSGVVVKGDNYWEVGGSIFEEMSTTWLVLGGLNWNVYLCMESKLAWVTSGESGGQNFTKVCVNKERQGRGVGRWDVRKGNLGKNRTGQMFSFGCGKC